MTASSFYANYAEIRAAGGVVTRDSQEWLSDLAPVSSGAAPAFGKDAFAQLAAAFHSQTHTRSMEYYREVGEAAGDVGLGLVKMSNLYEAVEKQAVDQAHALLAAAHIGAEVGLL